MKVLVTGGAGFIGANFVLRVREVRPDWQVTVLDALTYAGNRASLADLGDSVRVRRGQRRRRRAGRHAGAPTPTSSCTSPPSRTTTTRLDDPWPFMESNIIGTYRLLEAVRQHGERLHHISTDEVYGDLELDDPARFTEQTPVNPSSPYSATQGQRRPAGAGVDPLVRHHGHAVQLLQQLRARASTSRSSSRARSPASCRASSPSCTAPAPTCATGSTSTTTTTRSSRSSSRAGSARPTSSAPTASRTTPRSWRCCWS